MFLFACSFIYSFNPAYSREYKAWITIKPVDSTLKIEAFCQSPEDSQVKYKLVAKKIGRAGKTKTSQSGLVSLQAKEEKLLSRLNLSVSPEDKYEIRLEVYRDGMLVAEDSVVYP